ELVKVGMDRDIADDLSYRYYKNELTTKDLELLKMAFKSDIRDLNNKIDTVENNLNNKIDTKFNELDNKIDIIENNLKSEIRDLNNKIDTVENNLNNKIDTKFNELDNKIDIIENNLKSEIRDLNNKIDTVENNLKSEIYLVRKDMEMNKTELNSKLKLNNWMLGTIITINVGILLTLISIINSIINK
ncbi:BDR-repeat family protein, partial [Borrelia duttonii CR2A]